MNEEIESTSRKIYLKASEEMIQKLDKGSKARGVTRASYIKELIFQGLKYEKYET